MTLNSVMIQCLLAAARHQQSSILSSRESYFLPMISAFSPKKYKRRLDSLNAMILLDNAHSLENVSSNLEISLTSRYNSLTNKFITFQFKDT